MKNIIKKIIFTISIPFVTAWKWARRTIFKIPATEAELVLMSLALVLCCFWIISIRSLVVTNYVVVEKTKIIEQQAATIEKYKIKEKLVPVQTPSKVKIITITDHQLQQELAKTKQEAAKLREEKDHYRQLAKKYGKPSKPDQNPEQRVKTEEQVNDQFIKDWGDLK